MTKRASLAVVMAAFVALSPVLACAGIGTWKSCHDEVIVAESAETIDVKFDDERTYQKFTYYVKSYSGVFVVRVTKIEIHHKEPAGGKFSNEGLRDPDSILRYYRTEYENVVVLDTDGGERKSFVSVYSGPAGVLVEILSFIPISAEPQDNPPGGKEVSL